MTRRPPAWVAPLLAAAAALQGSEGVLWIEAEHYAGQRGSGAAHFAMPTASGGACVDHASSTVCWYEEIDHQPPRGHGDPADVWAAAEIVYLMSQLLLADRENGGSRK